MSGALINLWLKVNLFVTDCIWPKLRPVSCITHELWNVTDRNAVKCKAEWNYNVYVYVYLLVINSNVLRF